MPVDTHAARPGTTGEIIANEPSIIVARSKVTYRMFHLRHNRDGLEDFTTTGFRTGDTFGSDAAEGFR